MSLSLTIRQWISTGLKEKIGLSTEEMPKDCFSPNDLSITLTQLWCCDFKEYRGKCRDRSRVGLSFAILLYCFTSARTGEVHESTARRTTPRLEGNEITVAQFESRAMTACYKVIQSSLMQTKIC